jgi:hypothetical protein
VAQGTHRELLRDSAVYRRLHADWAAGTTLSDGAASPTGSVGVVGDHVS